VAGKPLAMLLATKRKHISRRGKTRQTCPHLGCCLIGKGVEETHTKKCTNSEKIESKSKRI